MDGILLVDKPKGWTSFDVVAKVRSLVRAELRLENPAIKRVKVGHTGTLDPSATGLLVLCIGSATKKVPSMIRHDKTYEVEMTLGSTSTTGDQEGEIRVNPTPKEVDASDLKTAMNSFLGEQWQTPPAYSAIKINGTRAYELARQGKEVKLEPRRCTIHSIELTSFNYPIARFTVSVSSGTYIRSLVEDIARNLGTEAYMSNLRRTKVDMYDIKDALVLGKNNLTIEQIKSSIMWQ